MMHLPDRPQAFEFAIETPRLVLRPPRHEDIPALVEGLGDPAVSRMLALVPHPYGRGDAEAFVALCAERNRDGRHLLLVMDHGGAVVGGIGLHGLQALPAVEDFGYWVARFHWGEGFATEAARGLLAHAFRVLGAERVPSGVFVDNPASLRVQDKLGFERVGTSRRFSLARGCEVEHIDTELTRARFEELWG